jgi:ubiquinone/menaquinone biosynthesis C-methylase UbiE
MRRLLYKILSNFRWAIPGQLNEFIKNYAELKFQKGYVKTFRENVPLFEGHFRKYRFYDEMKDILNIGSSSRVLDVGCGISTVLHFVGGERYGIDPLAEEYKRIYSFPEGIEVRKGFGEQIPFDNGFFDVVFCTNVLDHVEDPVKTVSEIHRVLKPGGYFILTIEIFTEKVTRDPGHPHLFMKDDVRPLIGGRFETEMEKSSPMMHIKEEDGKLELIESPAGTKELVLLLSKPRAGRAYSVQNPHDT